MSAFQVKTKLNKLGKKQDSDALNEGFRRLIGAGSSLFPIAETCHLTIMPDKEDTLDRTSIINQILDNLREEKN